MKRISDAINEAVEKFGREVLIDVIRVGVEKNIDQTVDHFFQRGMTSHEACARLIYLE
jgi:hypothetical protein